MPKEKKPKKATDLMSTQVLLASSGLAEFYRYFEQAGHGMFDVTTHISDLKVEQIILEVESRCMITFNTEVRIKIWKALRYQWFRGPGMSKPFIERTEVPRLELPMFDMVEQDSKFKFSDLESDRQRQVMRKVKHLAPGQSTVSLQTFQFEVYKRALDIIYEFRDLERSVQEWERRNPRSMVQEDLREEVMRMRLKSLIDFANSSVAVRRQKSAQLSSYSSVLVVVQIVTLALTGLMMFAAYNALSGTPPQLLFSFFVASKQFISGVAFFLASVFASVVADRKRGDPLIRELRKTVLSCERLIDRISDFRIATEDLRMARSEAGNKMGGNATLQSITFDQSDEKAKKEQAKKEEEPSKIEAPASAATASQAAERKGDEDREELRKRKDVKKKKKKDKDEALAIWAPDAGKLDSHEINIMQKHLAQSYKRLDPLPEDFKRNGGDRMGAFQGRLGGVKEDELCVKVTTGKQKKRQDYLQKLKDQAAAAQPKNPPPPMLAIKAHVQSQPRGGPDAQTLGRSLRDTGAIPLPPPAVPLASNFYFHAPRDGEGDEEKPLLAIVGPSRSPEPQSSPPSRSPEPQASPPPGASSLSSPPPGTFFPGASPPPGVSPFPGMSSGASPAPLASPPPESSGSRANAEDAAGLSPFVPDGEEPE
mmetsp:Transcript_60989/g.108410  ORF Transcript_60989/g.108410 Transcript_60989/m.108410 type:complete len:652 (+) Transcript_60989:108-2063(+)